jgi:hypothetical protein
VWRARGAGRGIYVVRLRAGGDVRRLAVRRGAARFRGLRAYERAGRCDALRLFKLERPVFGGRDNRAVDIAFRLRSTTVVQARVERRGRVVRRYPARTARAGTIHRLRLASKGLARGAYTVRIRTVSGDRTLTARLGLRRL